MTHTCLCPVPVWLTPILVDPMKLTYSLYLHDNQHQFHLISAAATAAAAAATTTTTTSTTIGIYLCN